jgi:hypothetical protein
MQASTSRRRDPAAVKGAQQDLCLFLVACRLHTALAMPDGRGLTEAYARRASQASTRTRLDLLTAAAARLTRARLRRVRLWPAAPAWLAGRGLMEGHARCATLASTRARQDPAAVMTARLTLSHPLQALQTHTALATPDGLGLMEAHARHVMQASTSRRRGLAAVTNAQQALCRLLVAC